MPGLESLLQSNHSAAPEVIPSAAYLLIRPVSFTRRPLLACPFSFRNFLFLQFQFDFVFPAIPKPCTVKARNCSGTQNEFGNFSIDLRFADFMYVIADQGTTPERRPLALLLTKGIWDKFSQSILSYTRAKNHANARGGYQVSFR